MAKVGRLMEEVRSTDVLISKIKAAIQRGTPDDLATYSELFDLLSESARRLTNFTDFIRDIDV